MGRAPVIVVAAILLGGSFAATRVLASDELRSDDQRNLGELAAYYLPVYGNGASYEGGLGQDRAEFAASEMKLWKQVEVHEADRTPNGDRVFGERSLDQRLDVIQRDLGVSDTEFDALLEDVRRDEPLLADVPALDEADDAPLILPLYTELALVCGAPSAVAIYPATPTGDQPVLSKYQSVTRFSDEDRPEALLDAWVLETVGPTKSYAWLPRAVPEVVVVVASTGDQCDLEDVAAQVSIERGDS